jgi:hypothetical protein
LPEFDVSVVTVRLGTHTIRVKAPDANAARVVVQSDCDNGQCHCPPEWCTDDVGSDVADVRLVAPDGVTLVGAERVTPGTQHADDSLRRGAGARG